MKIACYNLRAGGRAGNRVHWNRVIETYWHSLSDHNPVVATFSDALHVPLRRRRARRRRKMLA